MKKRFSIILPIYQNEDNLPTTVSYILEKRTLFPGYEVELVMVCDGSSDHSYEIMKEFQKQYPDTIKIATFTKNYGQRAAVHCGMSMATGDVIGVISADLQEPFDLFVQMLEYWEKGDNLVLAYREKRDETGVAVKCAVWLHKFINKNINPDYPIGGFDFFIVDKSIADAFVLANTANNSMQLLLLELAGAARKIGYVRAKRKIGKSGWSLAKKINQTINIISIYTDKPFYFMLYLGVTESILSVVLFITSILVLQDQYMTVGALCLFTMGGLLLSLGYFGICSFKWMTNSRKVPCYVKKED